MSMKYSKSVSLFACLLTVTGLNGCQSSQQKVYQQASLASPEYQSAPYHQTETVTPKQRDHNQLFSVPAPAPASVGNEFPPAAPPSLAPLQTKNQTSKKRSLILKTSQEEFSDDQQYFRSEFSSDMTEPAQKYLGLVPHYSTVSSSVSRKVKQMNGKVKDFYSSMKSHLKTPQWIQKMSGSHVEESVTSECGSDLSCVDSQPYLNQSEFQAAPLAPIKQYRQPVFPEPLHTHPESKPLPLQSQPKLENGGLPRIPVPKQTRTYRENTWKVSATIEQLPVKDYSTLEDEIELWPYSKQRMLQANQIKQFKKIQTVSPVSTPRQFKKAIEPNHPRELSVPSMLTKEKSTSIRKISLQQFEDEPDAKTIETLHMSTIVITPRKY